MKHIVRKAYWDFEKEEKWLNEMSAKGMALTDYSWCRYVFTETSNNEYTYRIEFLGNKPTHAESIAYIRFLEESGVECVATYNWWIFLRRKSSEGSFDIYSDIESKIKHYKRINHLGNFLIVFELTIAIIEFWAAWNKYTVNGDWIIFLCLGVFLTVLAVIFFFIGHPIRKTLKALKKEQGIRE